MIEINAVIDNILRTPLTTDGISVSYFYDVRAAKMPAVTYYMLTEREDFRVDNAEESEYVQVQIDVWADKRSEMSSASLKVNELMQAHGFIRAFVFDVPKEHDTQVYHRTMRFEREVFNNESI